MKNLTQCDMILDELRDGSTVTKLTAIHNGIGNIHEVVRQLRKRGHNIKTVYANDLHGKRYSKYKLAAAHA